MREAGEGLALQHDELWPLQCNSVVAVERFGVNRASEVCVGRRRARRAREYSGG